MKGIDIFCTSSASTAICMSMQDQRSIVRSHHHHHHHGGGGGGRAIDRHNPHVRDGPRRRRRSRSSALTSTTSTTTNSTQPIPSNKPKQHHNYHHHHHQKSTTTTTTTSTSASTKKKSLASSSSYAYKPISPSSSDDQISPVSSSRYLLNDTPFFQVLSDPFHAASALVPLEPPSSPRTRALAQLSSESRALVRLEPSSKSHALATFEPASSKSHALATFEPASSKSHALVPLKPSSRSRRTSVNHRLDSSLALLPSSSSSSSTSTSTESSTGSPDQVVVLRVSLHCRGCEAKVRKHVSRMEGVTSFNIDFPAKKVTVIGNVTPLDVLNSVSRVKNAQFWPSSNSSSAPISAY